MNLLLFCSSMVIGVAFCVWGIVRVIRAIAQMIRDDIKQGTSSDKTRNDYNTREREFKSNMDERQHQLNAQLRGASLVEVWMTFEARLYALEQRVVAAEKRNLDDGK